MVKKQKKPALNTHEKIAIARDKATETVLAIVFTVLLDKWGADMEIMQKLWKDVCSRADEISEGRVNVKDLCKVLRDEYDINITGGIR